jgi:hypothetical protein
VYFSTDWGTIDAVESAMYRRIDHLSSAGIHMRRKRICSLAVGLATVCCLVMAMAVPAQAWRSTINDAIDKARTDEAAAGQPAR